MTPVQHQTQTYGYGAQPSNAYNMLPSMQSPSMNPASQSPMVSNMGAGSGSGSGLPHGSYGSNSPALNQGYNVASSGSYNLQTPAYQNPVALNTQRLIGSIA